MDAHIERCRIVTARHRDLFRYHVADSVDFLQALPERSVDLLYLDTGDVWPIEPSALHQLREAEAIGDGHVLRDDGVVLIDDVRTPVPRQYGVPAGLGKGTYSIPYLRERGFRILFDGYQVALGAGGGRDEGSAPGS